MDHQKEKAKSLIDFLDQKVFNPIMEARPELYSSEREQKMLEYVKKFTSTEIDHFHRKDNSPEQILDMFFRELYYETSGILGKDREDLELPRFLEIRDEFMGLFEDD
jgi:hypothetical protein